VPITSPRLNLNASRPEVRASTRVPRRSFGADSGRPKAHRRSAPSGRGIGSGCGRSLHESLPPQSARRRGQEGCVNEYRQNTLAHCPWRVGCLVRHRLRGGRPDQQADPPPPAPSVDGTGLETPDHCPSSGRPAGSGPPTAPPWEFLRVSREGWGPLPSAGLLGDLQHRLAEIIPHGDPLISVKFLPLQLSSAAGRHHNLGTESGFPCPPPLFPSAAVIDRPARPR
jgi:hypothetical protein